MAYQRKGGDSQAKLAVQIPVEFRKDSMATLAGKACADFNVDAAYFRRAFPEKGIGAMTVINLAVGAMTPALDANTRSAWPITPSWR